MQELLGWFCWWLLAWLPPQEGCLVQGLLLPPAQSQGFSLRRAHPPGMPLVGVTPGVFLAACLPSPSLLSLCPQSFGRALGNKLALDCVCKGRKGRERRSKGIPKSLDVPLSVRMTSCPEQRLSGSPSTRGFCQGWGEDDPTRGFSWMLLGKLQVGRL